MEAKSEVRVAHCGLIALVLFIFSAAAFAQFTASIQGAVQDSERCGSCQGHSRPAST